MLESLPDRLRRLWTKVRSPKDKPESAAVTAYKRRRAARADRSLEDKTPPAIGWLRAVGGVGTVVGLCGLAMPIMFWPTVCVLCASVLLIAIDLWLENRLRGRWALRLSITAIMVIAGCVFAKEIVFVSVPLRITASSAGAAYPPGTVLDGMPWNPEWLEVALYIENESSFPYDDVAIIVKPEIPIVSIHQTTNMPGVFVEDAVGYDWRATMKDLGQAGRSTLIDPVVLATTAGYRIHCQHLPPHGVLTIRLGLANMAEVPKYPTSGFLQMRPKLNSGAEYFLANRQEDDIYVFPKLPASLPVSGIYTAALRAHALKFNVVLNAK